jgi:hypothetical protein
MDHGEDRLYNIAGSDEEDECREGRKGAMTRGEGK